MGAVPLNGGGDGVEWKQLIDSEIQEIVWYKLTRRFPVIDCISYTSIRRAERQSE